MRGAVNDIVVGDQSPAVLHPMGERLADAFSCVSGRPDRLANEDYYSVFARRRVAFPMTDIEDPWYDWSPQKPQPAMKLCSTTQLCMSEMEMGHSTQSDVAFSEI
jgi:hypothetical protein